MSTTEPTAPISAPATSAAARPAVRTAIVPREEIFALRWAVLRTGLPREAAVYEQDALPGTFHVAAYRAGSGADSGADSGEVLGCATFFPQPFPDPLPAGAPDGSAASAYRFRGVGSAPEVRGQGFGAAVIRAGLALAAERGAHWVWCDGRVSARGFYEHLGFTAAPDVFDLAPSGPHHRFLHPLTPRG
jgi:GNAT superfamily N-acetyltransferase